MDAFEEYLLSEYNLPSNVCCNNFKYTHSTKNKVDKSSNRPITNHIIRIKIDSYDANHNLISTHSEVIQDGHISRTKQNKLINISPDELNNRFGAAKLQISQTINAEYTNKLNDIQEKINELNSYVKSNGVIPNQFINEPQIAAKSNEEPAKKKNKHFEFSIIISNL